MTGTIHPDGNESVPRWQRVYERLSDADRTAPLEGSDLEQLSIAAYLIGKDAESTRYLARAHQAFLNAGETRRAARSAFWLGFIFTSRSDNAQAAGWLARAQRLLDGDVEPCVERGYVLVPFGLQQVRKGDFGAAADTFAEAAAVGERFGEPDLVNLARHGHARTLIALGEVARGVTMLDEVMVAVTAGELSPILSGVIYCSVISACFDMFDVRRAQEWTDALNRWCASQPDLVPYRGECLAHRAEIMQLQGVWPGALQEARRACECLSQSSGQPALGAAFYQVAEVHRLRGEFQEAEDAYAAAAQAGRTPQPGLALLRLAQRRPDAARAAIVRAVEEARDRRMRSRLLAAAADILLAAGETSQARAAADELSSIAAAINTPFIRATSAFATGAVLLAEGHPADAHASLRDAWALWQEIGVPYEAARTRVLLARACRQVGDDDGAQIEVKAAARAFEELGAAVDLAGLQNQSGDRVGGDAEAPLTAREREVLKLVASGMTNRHIAEELRISEKTVARHLSNIFMKLDLPSRAAATAYAFKHHLT